MSTALPAVASELVPWARVEALFDDLAALTEIREVRMKGGGEARAGGPSRDLVAARAALLAGHALGVQVRYVHDGTEWCDTILREREGVRIVRIVVPIPGGP